MRVYKLTIFILIFFSCKKENPIFINKPKKEIKLNFIASDLYNDYPTLLRKHNLNSISKIVIKNNGFVNTKKILGDTIHFAERVNDSIVFEDTKWNRNTYYYNKSNIMKTKIVLNCYKEKNEYEWTALEDIIIKNNLYRADSTVFNLKNDKLIYKEVYKFNSKTIKSYFYNQKGNLSHTTKIEYNEIDYGNKPRKTETKYFWKHNDIKQIIKKSNDMTTITDFNSIGIPIKEVYTLNENNKELTLVMAVKTVQSN